MAQNTGFQPLVSVVNYDITSSDEDFSEIESADGQAFVYASSKLPAPRLPAEFSAQSSQSDSLTTETDSEAEDRCHAPFHITEPEASSFLPPLASSPVEKPQERLDERQVPRPSEDSHNHGQSSLAAPSTKRIKLEVVEISSSSSESEEQTAAEEVASNKKRRPYALKMAELSAEMRRFLAASRSFHTRAHSLERSSAAVSSSTYAKAEERMLCKYCEHLENSAFDCLFVC